MIRATLRMTVRAGRQREFEIAWRAVAAGAARAPGQLGQALLRDPADSRVFVITSDWESATAFGVFERSPEQDELTAPLRALRESAEMTVFEIVARSDSGSSETYKRSARSARPPQPQPKDWCS